MDRCYNKIYELPSPTVSRYEYRRKSLEMLTAQQFINSKSHSLQQLVGYVCTFTLYSSRWYNLSLIAGHVV